MPSVAALSDVPSGEGLRMRRALVAGFGLASWMTGCSGGGVTPSGVIASDACSLLQQEVIDQGPEAMMAGELTGAFEELEERAREAGISDPEMQEAMHEQCPEVFDELEALFGS
jgi:hypothetical protein